MRPVGVQSDRWDVNLARARSDSARIRPMSFSVYSNSRVPFDVLHEDAALLVVYKPAGIVTQPGKGHERDSLLNGLFARYGNALQNLGEDRGWGLLHRLDRDTSGLVLVALRTRAYENLLDQFKRRAVKKTYYAIVAGVPRTRQGVIQLPIAEVVGTRKRAVARRDGKQAITAYRVLDSQPQASLIEAMPKTGRLHQIRLHLAELGHPVLGDEMYGASRGKGAASPPPVRLCLHAAALSFIHPEDGRRMNVTCAVPADFLAQCKRLGLRFPPS